MNKIPSLGKYGKWALVAGASEGLGAAFAKCLAENGKNLILVSKDSVQLNFVAEQLQNKYKVEVRKLDLDLADHGAKDVLSQEITDTECSLIIYNAAYGPVKKFLQNTESELDYYIDLNSRLPLQLAHSFAKVRIGSNPSGFLLMSSLAGLRGTLMVAPYAATKAFNWNLMEGLYYEFKDTNINFTSCCAGPIATPGYLSTKPREIGLKPKDADPEFVAYEALKALGKRAIHIPGKSNRFTDLLLSHLLPHRWASTLVNKTMLKIYAKQWGSGYHK